jgi:hypothetical protein
MHFEWERSLLGERLSNILYRSIGFMRLLKEHNYTRRNCCTYEGFYDLYLQTHPRLSSTDYGRLNMYPVNYAFRFSGPATALTANFS